MTSTQQKQGQVVPQTNQSSMTPFEEMDRLFNRMWENGFISPFERRRPWSLPLDLGEAETRLPEIDVIDRKDEIVVKAELPGMTKESLDISISGDYLTIKGEKLQKKEEKGEYYRSEIRRGSFMRSIHLPAPVVGDKAKARFKDGVLRISLPKSEKSQRRRVEIS